MGLLDDLFQWLCSSYSHCLPLSYSFMNCIVSICMWGYSMTGSSVCRFFTYIVLVCIHYSAGCVSPPITALHLQCSVYSTGQFCIHYWILLTCLVSLCTVFTYKFCAPAFQSCCYFPISVFTSFSVLSCIYMGLPYALFQCLHFFVCM